MKYFLFLILTATTPNVEVQKNDLDENIEKQAMLELNQAMTPPEGPLYKFGQKHHITGEYTMRLTLREKGQVVSVFVEDKKEGNIVFQNSLKDKLLDFQFSFKLPKKKDYKLSYTFKF